MLELTTENAADYLIRQGWVSGGFCQVEELSGGVSNIVYRVKTFKGWYVLKQSRPQLRTADPWFSDLNRVFREIDVMQMLAPRMPSGIVPEVLFRDDANYAFLMSHAPRDARDWRSVLLEGKVDTGLGETAGRILGQMHEATPATDPALGGFRDKTVFDQLRVDPFYRRIAERCPDVAHVVAPLIDDVMAKSICLCHGDFSPKNLLWSGEGFTLVDYETAHLGDPAFDLGFFLSHLFLKAIVHPEQWENFRFLFAGFWRGYQDSYWFKPFEALMSDGIAHLGACLLARVDGTSPAPYLTDVEKKDAARRIAKCLLLDRVVDWNETVALLRDNIDAGSPLAASRSSES
jgi:aminoglycoside phosphotransferase (APT) family kinase protein